MGSHHGPLVAACWYQHHGKVGVLPPIELGLGNIELVGVESEYNRESVFFMLF